MSYCLAARVLLSFSVSSCKSCDSDHTMKPKSKRHGKLRTTPKRSALMSKIRAKNTQPEMTVRRALHGLGYRFRLHVRKLPGCPDIVMPRHGTIIQVKGCFWHGHRCLKGR